MNTPTDDGHRVLLRSAWSGTRATAGHALAAAVLETAFDDLRANCDAPEPKRQRLYCEARHWVMSEDRDWPFSFVNICEFLNLSPAALRAQLGSLPKAKELAA